mgnify:CR=1 FL=1|jgi:rubrerythrin
MSKLFSKNIENFICENCGAQVKGNGYTNHCPHCLYSKHVDINPGDRDCTCGSLMEPLQIEKKGSELIIVHRCLKCGFVRKNKTSPEDNFDSIIAVMKKTSL